MSAIILCAFSKKELSRVKTEHKNPVQHDHLPDFYGRDECTLLARDPKTLFLYWEVTWDRRKMISSYIHMHFDQAQKYIRLYDVTNLHFLGDYSNGFIDVPVHNDDRSWYFNNVIPGRHYIADYGVFYEGRFLPLLRSNVVETPRNTPAHWGEPIVDRLHVDRQHMEQHRRIEPKTFESFLTYSFYD